MTDQELRLNLLHRYAKLRVADAAWVVKEQGSSFETEAYWLALELAERLPLEMVAAVVRKFEEGEAKKKEETPNAEGPTADKRKRPMRLRVELYDARGVFVEGLVDELDKAQEFVAHFLKSHGTDPDEDGEDAMPGSVLFFPVKDEKKPRGWKVNVDAPGLTTPLVLNFPTKDEANEFINAGEKSATEGTTFLLYGPSGQR